MTKKHVDYVKNYASNLIPVIPNGVTLSPNSKIDPVNRGKVPGQRNADGAWYGGWKDLPPATMALARLWDSWGAYIGARGGIAGMIGLDVDLTVRKDANRVLALAHGIYGRTLSVRRVDHPDHAKLLICLRLEGPMPASFNMDVVQSDGSHGQIQFLGPGRYFNMHGIHPKRLKPYMWENDPGRTTPGAGQSDSMSLKPSGRRSAKTSKSSTAPASMRSTRCNAPPSNARPRRWTHCLS